MDEIRNFELERERTGAYRLGRLIKDNKVAILTTLGSDRRMHGQPVPVLESEGDEALYFFISASSARADDVRDNGVVSVSYTLPERRYVSVSGRGELVLDRALMRKLWRPACYASFPLGLDDPDLALLRVRVERAECWDGASSRVLRSLSFGDDLVVGDDIAMVESPAAANEDRETAEAEPYQRPWERETPARLLFSLEHIINARKPRLSRN